MESIIIVTKTKINLQDKLKKVISTKFIYIYLIDLAIKDCLCLLVLEETVYKLFF